MRLIEIREYVESKLKVNLESESRERKFIYARAIYYELCNLYAKNDKNKRISLKQIGKSIGYDHATVIHHRRNTIPYLFNNEEKYKNIFDAFSPINKRSKLESDFTLEERYDLLFKRYIRLNEMFHDASKVKRKESELEKLIGSINEDKIDLFIERAKPMIKMINKAKFN